MFVLHDQSANVSFYILSTIKMFLSILLYSYTCVVYNIENALLTTQFLINFSLKLTYIVCFLIVYFTWEL